MVILGMLFQQKKIRVAQSSNPTGNDGFCTTKNNQYHYKVKVSTSTERKSPGSQSVKKSGNTGQWTSIVASVVDMDTAQLSRGCGVAEQ